MSTKERRAILEASKVFERYAAIDAPDLPVNSMSALQVALHRWQVHNFGGGNPLELLAGVQEELGELAYVVLKATQKIRGYDDRQRVRDEVGDARFRDPAIWHRESRNGARLESAPREWRGE